MFTFVSNKWFSALWCLRNGKMMIMRKFFLILYAFLSPLFILDAQTTKEEIMADLNKAGSNYCVYSPGQDAPTRSPKGYKPFYISHYGRHGSRYYISDIDFKKMYGPWTWPTTHFEVSSSQEHHHSGTCDQCRNNSAEDHHH